MRKKFALLVVVPFLLSGCISFGMSSSIVSKQSTSLIDVSSCSSEQSISSVEASSCSSEQSISSVEIISSSSKKSSSQYSNSKVSSYSSKQSSSVSKSSYSPSASLSYSQEEDSLWDKSQDNLRVGVKNLSFYNFNDLHGATEYNEDNSEPGIIKLSTYLKEERTKIGEENFVLTSTGDMAQGSFDSNENKGELVTTWMNLIKFDSLCVGNHDFDWGVDSLINMKDTANFPFLACNILYKDTLKPVEWVKPFTTITKNGVHIGIVGAIGENQTTSITQSIVKDYVFDDPTDYAIYYADYLKEHGADIVLYLLHDSVSTINNEITKHFNLGFCGHSHSSENKLINGVPFIQAYSNGKDIGCIKINYDFDNSKSSVASYQVKDLRYLSVEDDQETTSLYNYYLEDCGYRQRKETVVAYLDKDYPSSASKSDGSPMLSCKAMYTYFTNLFQDQYDIEVVTTNNSRATLYQGYLTYGELYKAFPFENEMCLCKVKGNYMYYFPTSVDCAFYPTTKSYYYPDQYYYALTQSFNAEKYVSYIEEKAHGAITIVERVKDIYVRDIVADYLSSL